MTAIPDTTGSFVSHHPASVLDPFATSLPFQHPAVSSRRLYGVGWVGFVWVRVSMLSMVTVVIISMIPVVAVVTILILFFVGSAHSRFLHTF